MLEKGKIIATDLDLAPLGTGPGDARQRREEVVRLLGHVGLDAGFLDRYPAEISGGQRQRLTIARALVRRPELLILDDSASALDFATDAALRKALSKLPWKPTVVLISQRVSSIRHADKIVVLDDGHMAGLGTHTQLQQTCPVYQEICRSQEKGEASAS